MPRLFVPAGLLTGRRASLAGPELRHLRALRLRRGAAVTLFDGTGNEHEAVLLSIGPRSAELEIRSTTVADTPGLGPPIILIAGVLKGQRMDILVEKTTELGVARIVPVLSEFTVARPASHRSARAQRWRRIAVSAATQSGQARVPAVDAPVPFADVVAAAGREGLAVLFWEHERRVLLPALGAAQPKPPRVVVAVGPEGGFTRQEVELARAAGFAVSGLGPRTLRAETAGIVALALCQATWGDLRSVNG